MNEFALPTNIKQIGTIEEGMRIYMEDYVCTYLHQYAEAGGYDERLALLVGRYLLIDGQPVLFINGAIQGKHVGEKEGLLYFTEKSGAYAEAIMAEFFEGMEIVGWTQTQPGYGTFLNQQYGAYHFREFPKQNQVMFVIDPLENANSFYVYNEDRSGLVEATGYFIYYDKNLNMHEYMLNNKSTDADYFPQEADYIDLPKLEKVEPEPAAFFRRTERTEKSPKGKTPIKKREPVRDQKRALNLLASLSAVLFVVSFVMGAGLIQSQDRISALEGQVLQLNTAYRGLYAHLSGAAAVFADETVPTVTVPAAVIEEDTHLPETQEAGLEIGGIPVHPPINPQPTPEPVVRFVPETYTIQPGDSLIAISLYFYGTDAMVDAILELNGLTDPDRIVAGHVLLLP